MNFIERIKVTAWITCILSGVVGGVAERAEAEDGAKPVIPRVELSPVRSSIGGMHSYVPERWSLISIKVTNSDQTPREVVSSTYFDSAPTLQYARKIWVPARSKLQTWVPVLVPAVPVGQSPNITYHSMVLDASQDADKLLKENGEQLLQAGTVTPPLRNMCVTGRIDDPNGLSQIEAFAAYNLIVAARRERGLARRSTDLQESLFTPDDFSLDPFDHLVISCNRSLGDPAGLMAIRRWVHRGGQLWVMLNQVDPQLLEAILGDGFACEAVDQIGLTTVRIEPAPKNAAKKNSSTVAEFEIPVEMLRVVVDEKEVDVEYTVNGWPAAFTKTLGKGQVTVTTLGPRGWMRSSTREEILQRREEWARSHPGSSGDAEDSLYTVVPAMKFLSEGMLATSVKRADFNQSLAVHAADYIGYSIPSRGLIGGMLVAVIAIVAAAGGWLWKRQSLEHLGWFGPVSAVVVAVVILVIGMTNRHQKAPQAAALQVVEMLPGIDDQLITGGLAFYSPETMPWSIGTHAGGRLLPEMSGMEGTTRRLLWNDLGQWAWENLKLETPQRTARYVQSTMQPSRYEARGTFGPDGLTGKVTGPDARSLTDAVLATREGRIGVSIGPDGKFTATSDHIFTKDQYLESGLVGDEQNRRGKVYPEVLAEYFGPDSSGPPLLMAWSSEFPVGLEFDEGLQRLGSSLLLFPLTIDRPAPGTKIKIPSTLLPFKIVEGPDGSSRNVRVWNARRFAWQSCREFNTFWLRFQTPRELHPLEVTSARLTVQVSGPVVEMNLYGISTAEGGAPRPVPFAKWDDPVGSRTFELTDRQLLQLQSGGGLTIGISAGDPRRLPETEMEVNTNAPTNTGVNGVGNLPGSKTGQLGGKDDEKDYGGLVEWKIERLVLELSGTIPAE